MLKVTDLTHQTYLGDGVYAGWDGYHIVIWLEHGGSYTKGGIALEPPVLEDLNRLAKRIRGTP